MISDFPSSEEAELRRDYAASRKRLGAAPDSDLSQLAASSVVRSGVRAAEQKAGLKQLTEPWKNWRNMEKCHGQIWKNVGIWMNMEYLLGSLGCPKFPQELELWAKPCVIQPCQTTELTT